MERIFASTPFREASQGTPVYLKVDNSWSGSGNPATQRRSHHRYRSDWIPAQIATKQFSPAYRRAGPPRDVPTSSSVGSIPEHKCDVPPLDVSSQRLIQSWRSGISGSAVPTRKSASTNSISFLVRDSAKHRQRRGIGGERHLAEAVAAGDLDCRVAGRSSRCFARAPFPLEVQQAVDRGGRSGSWPSRRRGRTWPAKTAPAPASQRAALPGLHRPALLPHGGPQRRRVRRPGRAVGENAVELCAPNACRFRAPIRHHAGHHVLMLVVGIGE